MTSSTGIKEVAKPEFWRMEIAMWCLATAPENDTYGGLSGDETNLEPFIKAGSRDAVFALHIFIAGFFLSLAFSPFCFMFLSLKYQLKIKLKPVYLNYTFTDHSRFR